mmetsp:Transcript_29739/g.88947  ORF Transcript_29739/g.88947 Transcript_29739/m.88947 type:complete len:266 (+) Transcript_29739:1197-1994(+)
MLARRDRALGRVLDLLVAVGAKVKEARRRRRGRGRRLEGEGHQPRRPADRDGPAVRGTRVGRRRRGRVVAALREPRRRPVPQVARRAHARPRGRRPARVVTSGRPREDRLEVALVKATERRRLPRNGPDVFRGTAVRLRQGREGPVRVRRPEGDPPARRGLPQRVRAAPRAARTPRRVLHPRQVREEGVPAPVHALLGLAPETPDDRGRDAAGARPTRSARRPSPVLERQAPRRELRPVLGDVVRATPPDDVAPDLRRRPRVPPR